MNIIFVVYSNAFKPKHLKYSGNVFQIILQWQQMFYLCRY